MKKDTLLQVGMWAEARVASGEEPPWTFYKLKQLSEIARELAEGMEASVTFVTPDNEAEVQSDDNIVQISAFRPAKPESEVALPT